MITLQVVILNPLKSPIAEVSQVRYNNDQTLMLIRLIKPQALYHTMVRNKRVRVFQRKVKARWEPAVNRIFYLKIHHHIPQIPQRQIFCGI